MTEAALNNLSLVLSWIRRNKTQRINPQTLLHLDWQPLVRQTDPQAPGMGFFCHCPSSFKSILSLLSQSLLLLTLPRWLFAVPYRGSCSDNTIEIKPGGKSLKEPSLLQM